MLGVPADDDEAAGANALPWPEQAADGSDDGCRSSISSSGSAADTLMLEGAIRAAVSEAEAEVMDDLADALDDANDRASQSEELYRREARRSAQRSIELEDARAALKREVAARQAAEARLADAASSGPASWAGGAASLAPSVSSTDGERSRRRDEDERSRRSAQVGDVLERRLGPEGAHQFYDALSTGCGCGFAGETGIASATALGVLCAVVEPPPPPGARLAPGGAIITTPIAALLPDEARAAFDDALKLMSPQQEGTVRALLFEGG